MARNTETLAVGDQFQDCAATMTYLGPTEDGKLRFSDSLEGDEFTLEPGDVYLESLPQLDRGMGR